MTPETAAILEAIAECAARAAKQLRVVDDSDDCGAAQQAMEAFAQEIWRAIKKGSGQ